MASGVIPKYMDGTDSGWIDTEITFASGKLYYRRIGDVVELCGDGIRLQNSLDSGDSVVLGTLPSEARPKDKRAFMTSNALAGYGFITISTEGVVALYNRSGNTYTGGTSGTRLFIASMYF